ncbi:MAG: hypothetical protein ACOC3T_05510 [Bacteroidota bacterium]
MVNFSERYKTLTDIELVRVVKNQADYQAEAVEAAKREIIRRNLTEQELEKASDELEARQQEKQMQYEQRSEYGEKLKSFGNSVLEVIIPFRKSAPTAERLKHLITIVFGLIAAIQIFSQSGMISYILTDDIRYWDISTAGYLLSLLLLPTAVILFALRKKSGWILLTAYLTWSCISSFGLMVMLWYIQPSGVTAPDGLLPATSLLTQIIIILIYGGTVWLLNKKILTEYFNISRKTAVITIVVTGIPAILFIASFLIT